MRIILILFLQVFPCAPAPGHFESQVICADYPKVPKWHGEFKRQFRSADGSVRQDFYDETDKDALQTTLAIVEKFVKEIFG